MTIDRERAAAVGLGNRSAAPFLRCAVELAFDNATAGQLPFSVLVVRDGDVFATGVNTTLRDRDPVAHAEVAAVRNARHRLGQLNLTGATVVSSCEPCAMCHAVGTVAGGSDPLRCPQGAGAGPGRRAGAPAAGADGTDAGRSAPRHQRRHHALPPSAADGPPSRQHRPVTQGRFVLGVGVGWSEQASIALDLPFNERGRITDELLDAIKPVVTPCARRPPAAGALMKEA